MDSPKLIRYGGLAAMLGGIVGILYAPFYALAYFATVDGAESLQALWVAAWAGVARPALEPLLTFASSEETGVVGEAADGEEAVRLARELRPAGDALLLRREALPPANLPGVDGTRA